MLAEVIGRDGRDLSASQTWQQALADADHLAILHAIWTAETAPARHQRYQDLLTAVLPAGYRQEPGHTAKWLWRTMRSAELAGLDARQVIAGAVAERDLTGARDIPAVIDARIRRRAGTLIPLPAPSWSAQQTDIADPERRAYAEQVAALMDARKGRIGEHAAESALPWAVSALGGVPDDPVARLEWKRRAASIGAYRELSGYNHPADPIGPEPLTGSPDLRAAWHEALAALGPAGGPDMRGMADGLLIHLRDTYPIETAWAPPWVGDELRQVRARARDAHLTALRATAEAEAARRDGKHREASQQDALAASYRAMRDAYRQRETALATIMADRTDWERATRHQRQLAAAADAELRRRHPAQPWLPLRSAEPEPMSEAQGDNLVATLGVNTEAMAGQVSELAVQHREFASTRAERQSLAVPAEDPDFEDLGQAFPTWAVPGRDALLQPPKPQIHPSEQVMGRIANRSLDIEAAD